MPEEGISSADVRAEDERLDRKESLRLQQLQVEKIDAIRFWLMVIFLMLAGIALAIGGLGGEIDNLSEDIRSLSL